MTFIKLGLTLTPPPSRNCDIILQKFLDAIASLDLGYESQSVRIIKANIEYIAKH